jgi:glutamate formiminotransferase / 5-formyltetrahydrofolate cyclo-ligase
MLECVINISEGRRADVIDRVAAAAEGFVLDVHTDRHHHRSVFTLVGEHAARAVTAEAVAAIDLRRHDGVHPRIGAVDVVPFVALGQSDPADALAARDRFATWAADALGIPCFLYGPERTLPDIRRHAWRDLRPDHGPTQPHPSAGAIALGVRPPLVAYNLWLRDPDLTTARRLARDLRGPAVRALGLAVGSHVQVSMNLIDPLSLGPDVVYDRVAVEVEIARAELVGLVPAAVLDRIDERRWPQLDLSAHLTIEDRAAACGVDPT